MANQINIIRPYRWEGMWVFDDESVELDKEPFVGGAAEIIDVIVAHKGIRNASAGFLLLFSADPFPGARSGVELGTRGNLWKRLHLE